MVERELRSTLTKDWFALKSPVARLMFCTAATRRPREEAWRVNCLVSSQEEADQNDVDINGGDFNMSTC